MKVDGFKIDILIAKQGIRRNEFCKRYGIKPQTILRVIKTNVASTLTTVKIADGLGVSVNEILLKDNL